LVTWPQQAIDWPELASHGSPVRDIAAVVFTTPMMPTEDNNHAYEDCEPSPLFRNFAAKCIQLAQAASLPEKRALYLKMASVWHQMAQRWEKKGQPSL
jgi:hypothetical protein